MPCRMKPPSASSPVFQLSRWSASSTCSCSGTGSPSSVRRSRSRTSTSPLSTRPRTISACRPAKSVSPSASAVAAKSSQSRSACLADLGIRRARPRHQPGADHVADQRLHRLSGVGVVAHEIARAVAQPGERRGDLGVGAGARRRSSPRCGGPAGRPRRRGRGPRSSAAGGHAAAPRPAPPRRSPGRASSWVTPC